MKDFTLGLLSGIMITIVTLMLLGYYVAIPALYFDPTVPQNPGYFEQNDYLIKVVGEYGKGYKLYDSESDITCHAWIELNETVCTSNKFKEVEEERETW